MKLAALCCAALLGVLVGAATASPKPPQGSASSERAVESRSRALVKAELDADVAAFRSFLSDDYVLLYVEPAVSGRKARWATRTKEEWATLLSSGREKYHSVDLRHTKVYLHGDVAIFTGEYAEKGTRDGEEYTEEGLFTETWVRRQGQWIMVGGVFP
jgi:ketosteroid isomerase-like protein